MLQKSRGILLHHFSYAEKSIILKVYTLEEGLQSFFLYRSSSKSKNQGALEPLSIIEIVAKKEEKRDMQTVKEIHVEHAYKNIGRNFLHNTVALFINEILVKTIRDQQTHEDLYYFLREWLISFDEAEFDPDSHLLFLAHLTRYFGIFPDCNNHQNLPHFNLTEGKFCQLSGNNPHILSGHDAILFTELFKIDISKRINREKRRFLLHSLVDYYFLHIPAFGELKSLPVLEELME